MQHRHTETEIAGPNQRNALTGGHQCGLPSFTQAGSAGDECSLAREAQLQDGIKSLRQTEVDGDIEIRHAGKLAGCKLRDAIDNAQINAACHCSYNLATAGRLFAQTLQGLPHAATAAVDQNANRCIHACRLAAAGCSSKHCARAFARAQPGP